MSKGDDAKSLGVSPATFFRWQKAGLTPDEMREFARIGRKMATKKKARK